MRRQCGVSVGMRRTAKTHNQTRNFPFVGLKPSRLRPPSTLTRLKLFKLKLFKPAFRDRINSDQLFSALFSPRFSETSTLLIFRFYLAVRVHRLSLVHGVICQSSSFVGCRRVTGVVVVVFVVVFRMSYGLLPPDGRLHLVNVAN